MRYIESYAYMLRTVTMYSLNNETSDLKTADLGEIKIFALKWMTCCPFLGKDLMFQKWMHVPITERATVVTVNWTGCYATMESLFGMAFVK